MLPYGVGTPPVNPAPNLRTIVKPDAPRWINKFYDLPYEDKSGAVHLGLALGLVAGIAALGALIAWLGIRAPGLASALFAVLLCSSMGAFLWAARRIETHTVRPPIWRYEGVAIKGEALSLLEDIDARFRYARKMIDEVPTGIDWEEVVEEVRALMWESAGHAAKVSTLDIEIHEMRYAARATPQWALKRTMEERRGDHWNMLKNAQLEADSLASVAGNAAAAAKVALLRTGSLEALEVAAPSARGLVARDALRDVRARLELLAEVWAQLDESNTVLAEQMDMERERQLEPKRSRRRNR